MDPIIPSDLGDAAKSPQLNAHTTRILFSENTWVFPAGELHEASFLRTLSPTSITSIASMEILFYFDDARDFHPGDKLTYYHRKAGESIHDGEDVDRRAIMRQYSAEIDQWERELAQIWLSKVHEIAGWKLQHLKLVFTTDEFVDYAFMEFIRLVSTLRFEHGLPPHFEVVAKLKFIGVQAETVMRELNTTEWTTGGACGFCVGGLH